MPDGGNSEDVDGCGGWTYWEFKLVLIFPGIDGAWLGVKTKCSLHFFLRYELVE